MSAQQPTETVISDSLRVRRIEALAADGHDPHVIAEFVGCSHRAVVLIVDRWKQKKAEIRAMATALGIAADQCLLLTGRSSELPNAAATGVSIKAMLEAARIAAAKPSGLGSLPQDVQSGAGGVAGPVNANDSHVVPDVVGSQPGALVGAEVPTGKVAAILLDEILKGTDVRHKWSHHGDPRYEQMAKVLGASRAVHRVVVVHDRKDLSIDDEASADVVIAGGKVIKNRNGPVGWSVERIYQGVEGAL